MLNKFIYICFCVVFIASCGKETANSEKKIKRNTGWIPYKIDSGKKMMDTTTLLPGLWQGLYRDIYGMAVSLRMELEVLGSTITGRYYGAAMAVDQSSKFEGELSGYYKNDEIILETAAPSPEGGSPLIVKFNGHWQATGGYSLQAMYGTVEIADYSKGVFILYRSR